MDVWCNTHFSCKDLESSNWNYHFNSRIFFWYQLVLLRDSEVPVFFFEISSTFPHVNHPAHQGDNHLDATRDVAWPHVFSWHVEDLQIWKLGDFPRWFCPPSNHHSTVWGNRFLTFGKSSCRILQLQASYVFFQLGDIQKQLASTESFKSPMLFRCTSIGGACGTFPPAEARRDEGLDLPGPAVLGYIRLLAQPKNIGGLECPSWIFWKRESGCQCFNEHFLPETARPSFIDWKTAGISSPNKTSDHKRGTWKSHWSGYDPNKHLHSRKCCQAF